MRTQFDDFQFIGSSYEAWDDRIYGLVFSLSWGAMAESESKNKGGREKGSLNRDKAAVVEKAKEMGVDPFEVLLYFVNGDYEALGYDEFQTRSSPTGETYDVLTIEPELRARCAMKACEFLYPKRRSVELTDDTAKGGLTLAYSDPKEKKK